MDYFLLTIGFVISGVLVILFFIRRWLNEFHSKSTPSDEIVEWLKTTDVRLSDNMNQFNVRLDKAAQVIAQVQKNIGEFSEIGRSMKDLQEFLQSPKIRGNIGEQILTDLLKEFLPHQSYQTQYSFSNGEKVDVVIKTSNGLISIDAKFPMANYKKMIKLEKEEDRKIINKEFERDVKKHITDIAKKYILVSEGTLDYALMYIPSESIYYEIVRNSDLYDFASKNRVLIVSPMSFYAYLKAILMSFEGQKIEQRAKEILVLLQSLQKDYQKTDEALSILNRHITNAYNQVSNVSRLFLTFGQKLDRSKMLEEKEVKEIKD